MKKSLLVLSALFFAVPVVFAQVADTNSSLTIHSNTIISSGDGVPFWLQMNQQGMIDDSDPIQELFILEYAKQADRNLQDKFQLAYGVNLVGRLSENSTFNPNEYWAQLHFKKWFLHAGAKAEPVFANGLSLSNGNFYLSNNARPLPRVGFGTNDFRLFQSGWFSKFAFDFEYNEYLLVDDRIVDDGNLHHKRLDVNYSITDKWTFSAGLDHWVFWGGTFTSSSGDFKMPGLEDYFRYITGRVGSSDAPAIDRANVAGNQLGQYLVSLEYDGESDYLKLYWQHPWEDRSGIQLENAPDGLWGVYWKDMADKPFIESAVLEYANTRDQSGQHHKYHPDSSRPDYEVGEGEDNYFTHGVYKSGFVSYDRMMGIPLFIPIFNEDGISKGFDNTRFWAIHNGLSGWINNSIEWKTKLSYSKHYGRHNAEYASPKEFLSMLVQATYLLPNIPLRCGFQLAYDHGSIFPSDFGAAVKLSYSLR